MLNKEDIKHLTHLAKLSEKDGENNFAEQISSILQYVEQLNEVDTENIAETTHITSSNVDFIRNDEVRDIPDIEKEKLLESMPQTQKKYLKTKKVL